MMINYYDANDNLVWFGTEEELTIEVVNAANEEGWTRVVVDRP